MVDRRRRWPALLGAALLVGVGVVGCATVPDSGPAVPVAVAGLNGSTAPEDSRVNAALPQLVPYAEPQISVAAYLNALGSTRNPGQLGDIFLSRSIRAAFDQNPQVVIVQDVRTTVGGIVGNYTTALFSGRRVGALDADGSFAYGGSGPWQTQVRLVRERGIWVFADPPPLVLSQAQFTGDFTAVNVYFAASPSPITGNDPHLVIPERRYVNSDLTSSTPTQVVDFVLGGPSDTLSRVSRNPLPKIKRTSRATVTGGDLVIELEPEAESASVEALSAFVAEVGWSHADRFSGRVRLLVGGRPLDVAGFTPSQPPSMWKRYNPATPDDLLPNYLVLKGGVEPADTPGAPARGPRLDSNEVTKGVSTAAVCLDLTRLAVVRSDPAGGQRLWIADASHTMQPTLGAPAIGRPSWGGSAATVVVPVGGRLVEVGVGNADQPTPIEVLGDGERLLDVTAVRLSLDGTRALVIAGSGAASRLYFGTLTGTGSGGALILTARQLAVGGSPRDISWWGPVTAAVAVVGPGSNAVSVAFVPVDGAPGRVQKTSTIEADPIRLATDPSTALQDTLPIQVGGRLYRLTINGPPEPTTIVGGTAPFFPG